MQAFTGSILESMKLYRVNWEVKELVDELQLRHGCCGARQPEDWFNISWVDKTYLNLHLPEVAVYVFSDAVV